MSGRTLTLAPADVETMLADSARDLFSTMFEAAIQERERSRVAQLPQWRGISGIVGLGGEIRGTVVFQGADAHAALITRQMLGEEPTPQLVRDAVGEIGNILAGGVKKRLETRGFSLSLTVPMVVEGQPHLVSGIGSESWTLLHMESAGHRFAVAARFAAPVGG